MNLHINQLHTYNVFSLFQVLTVVVGRFTFPQLARFNKEPGEDFEEPDPDDELKDLNPKYLPHWNPPLTEHKCKVARKDIKRRGHILGSLIHMRINNTENMYLPGKYNIHKYPISDYAKMVLANQQKYFRKCDLSSNASTINQFA